MLKEKSDSVLAMTAAVFFVLLVVYLSVQDTTAIGPL
jgi:hypothetical protein